MATKLKAEWSKYIATVEKHVAKKKIRFELKIELKKLVEETV